MMLSIIFSKSDLHKMCSYLVHQLLALIPTDILFFMSTRYYFTWWSVHDDVDPQYLHGVKWIGPVKDRRDGDQHKRCNTGTQLETHEIPNIVKDAFAFFDRTQNGGEIVV